MIEYLLSAAYIVGVVFTAYFVYKKLNNKNKDGDPEGLDFLTSCGTGVFWPIFVPLYVLFFILSS